MRFLTLLLLCAAATAQAQQQVPDAKWVVGDQAGQAYVLLPETVSGSSTITIQFDFFPDITKAPRRISLAVEGCDQGHGTAKFTLGSTVIKEDNWLATGEQVLDALAEGACQAARERST